MSTHTDSWAGYPMGPNIRTWLSISDEAYGGSDRSRPDSQEKLAFAEFLMEHIQSCADKAASATEGDLIEIVDELVAMDLPMVALKLIDSAPEQWKRSHFRGAFAEGIAAMQVEELERAEDCFRIAQELEPSEPAPYVNLAQIMLFRNCVDDAKVWCEAGLQIDPNNCNLWDLLTDCEIRLSGEFSHKVIRSAADALHSWAGSSLAAELNPEANSQTKAAALDPFYSQGERSHEFLIEYTGALGTAGDFDRIPQVVWQAEKLGSKPLPWKLRLHAAQAHLAMNQLDRFAALVTALRQDPQVPREIVAELDRVLVEESDPAHKHLPH